jgi:hypothetical protein
MYPGQVSSLDTGNVFTGNTNNDILVHGGNVTTTGTWLNQGAPYVLGGTITVEDASNSPVLTIAPGCSLKFNGDYEFRVGISQQGAIVAEGTAAAPIVFSTTTSPKTPGSWNAVSVYYRATDATSFAYCTFEYGGSDAGTVYADGSKLKLQNCTITQSGSGGVKVLEDVDIATFTGNTISNCGGHAIEMYPGQVSSLGTGNVYTGNTNNDILVHGGNVTKTGTWLNQEIPYVVSGTVTVEDASNSPVLTIAPGTTVKLQSGVEFRVGISQPGGLIADGTSDTITFTSSSSTPSAGDWSYLSFYYRAMDAQCQLKNCRIEYAGPDYGIIYIDDAKPTITGCDIGYSAAWGIYLTGGEYPAAAQLRADNNIHDYVDGDIREP